jgi:uncharacterized protein
VSYLQRVWKNAAAIHAEEGSDAEALLASTGLHDCVLMEKNSPQRDGASRLSAQSAVKILTSMGWSAARG